MRYFLGKRPLSFYTKVFIYVTLSISTTIVVVSSILYINYEKITLQLVHSSVKDNLSHISYSASVMVDAVKTQTMQIYLDSSISSLFYPNGLDAVEQRTALERLNMYHNTIPNIHSIYIYNGSTEMFYTDVLTMPEYSAQSSAAFFDQEAKTLIDHFKDYEIFSPIPRKIPSPIPGYRDTQYSNVYSFIFYDTPANQDKLSRVLILNISESWMRQIINSLDMNVNTDSNIFIIDMNGKLVNTSNKDHFLTDLGNEEYIKQIIHDTNSSYFIESVNGEKSLVTYVTSLATGWKFVQITPYSKIVAKINKMKSTTIFIGLVVLLAGFFAAALASRRIYTPFAAIMNKISSLEKKDRKDRGILKQEFIRNLVLFGTDDTIDSLQDKLDSLSIALSPKEHFVLVLFVIDNYVHFCEKSNLSDRNLYKYAVLNIATEICTASFNTEGIDLGGKHLALLINVLHDTGNWSDPLDEVIQSIQTNVEIYQKMSLSASVSSVGYSIVDANFNYKEALENSRYLLFANYKGIVYAKEVEIHKNNEYIYSVEKEKLLIHEIVLGKLDEAKKNYGDMVNQLTDCSINSYNTTILRLALALNTAIENFERGNDFPISFDISAFVLEISELELIQEVHQKFFRMFEHMIEIFGEQKSDKYDDLIQRIVANINLNYMDQNLSIYPISSDVRMSPVYLGRLFKKNTSKSISSYITDVRMEKAKELLLSSDDSINSIAERIGLSNGNYFFTLFKKMNGITPNEFRQIADKKLK